MEAFDWSNKKEIKFHSPRFFEMMSNNTNNTNRPLQKDILKSLKR